MRKNRLRTLWQTGETVINGWLHIPSSWSAEVMAHAGWDSLTMDMQHGLQGMETAIHMLQAISTTETVPLVRVNWNEPGSIMRLLDAGAYGVICPMVDTRADCEAFVGACRYPPQGYRSIGPTRARLYAGADYVDHANEEIITLAMVETHTALMNVEDIASVPGLDGIFVGPGDLQLSLRATTGSDDPAAMDAALQTIVTTCQKHNLIAGIFTTSPEHAHQAIERGFRFVTVKADTMLLSEYAQQIVRQTRRKG